MVLCCAVEVEDDGGKWSSVFHLAMYQFFNFVANGECRGTEGEKLSLPRLHYQLLLPIWKENSGPFRRSTWAWVLEWSICIRGGCLFIDFFKILLKNNCLKLNTKTWYFFNQFLKFWIKFVYLKNNFTCLIHHLSNYYDHSLLLTYFLGDILF